MFLALRELRFARGRFALIAAVIALITLLIGLLWGWLPACLRSRYQQSPRYRPIRLHSVRPRMARHHHSPNLAWMR